jgi:hypothetical protein
VLGITKPTLRKHCATELTIHAFNGGAFPHVTIGDDVVAQHRLITEWYGIQRLELVLGDGRRRRSPLRRRHVHDRVRDRGGCLDARSRLVRHWHGGRRMRADLRRYQPADAAGETLSSTRRHDRRQLDRSARNRVVRIAAAASARQLAYHDVGPGYCIAGAAATSLRIARAAWGSRWLGNVHALWRCRRPF